jgi:hypothetical protein
MARALSSLSFFSTTGLRSAIEDQAPSAFVEVLQPTREGSLLAA